MYSFVKCYNLTLNKTQSKTGEKKTVVELSIRLTNPFSPNQVQIFEETRDDKKITTISKSPHLRLMFINSGPR